MTAQPAKLSGMRRAVAWIGALFFTWASGDWTRDNFRENQSTFRR